MVFKGESTGVELACEANVGFPQYLKNNCFLMLSQSFDVGTAVENLDFT